MEKSSYVLTENVMEQKDMRLKDYNTVMDALKSGIDIEADEEIMMLSRCGKLYDLNLIGAIVWEGLKAKKPIPSIIGNLQEVFEIEPKRAEKDILSFIHDLEKKEFIRIKEM